MIVDTLDHLARYRALSPLLPLAMDFLRRRAADAPDGRYDLREGDAFASVETYTPQPAASKRWEAHRRYVDLQVILSGAECIGYAPLESLTVAEPHDPQRDLTWLAGSGSFIHMPAGSFMILHPHDAHMPGVAPASTHSPFNLPHSASPDTPAPVRKVVFKLAAATFGP